MLEDFGDYGDEAFLGFCAEDWRDYAPLDAEENHLRQLERNRQRELEEIKLEFADEANDAHGHERDLFDLVREHEEEEDWLRGGDGDDYLNCSWEE